MEGILNKSVIYIQMRKKIYFIMNHLGIGGIEICVVNTANALAKRGYHVVLLSVLNSNEIAERILPDIEVVYLTSMHRGGKSLIYKFCRRINSYWSLRRKIKSLKNSILVSTRLEYNIMLSKYASDDNLRIAQMHHDYVGIKNFSKDIRKSYHHIDYFFLLTEDVCKEVESMMKGYNRHTVCVTVPNLYPEADLPTCFASNRKNVALAVGRLSPEKGFLRLLDIWHEVMNAGKPYMLYIVGDGEEKEILASRIKELRLEQSVRLLGALPNQKVRKLMQESKVYCMTSYTEGFPLVLLESINNGLPQVAFDVRVGPRNLIVDGMSGYLVKDGDIREYSTKVLELFENAEKWKSMSTASRKQADRFSEENVVNKWLKIINS